MSTDSKKRLVFDARSEQEKNTELAAKAIATFVLWILRTGVLVLFLVFTASYATSTDPNWVIYWTGFGLAWIAISFLSGLLKLASWSKE